MKVILSFFKAGNTVLGIPVLTIVAIILVVTITLVFCRFFSLRIIGYLKKLTLKTKTDFDDVFIQVLEDPIRFLIIVLGMMIVRLLLIEYINPVVDDAFKNLLQFAFVIILCWIIYRSADVITCFLEKITSRTETELDDLLLPFFKKAIRISAVIIAVVKAAELFLGMSATALIGLIGGMGLTLGLVFKDIISNWFACAIIYLDDLFRPGDWVQLDDGKIVDADVESIGIRSTRFRNFDKTISVVPNAVIASAVVKNWSRMYKRRVKYSFRIDGIMSEKLESVLNGIRDIIKNDEDVHQEFHMVNFRELEGNARIIRLYYFSRTTLWKEHESVREKINLKILKFFEEEGIERLAYTIVDLSDDRPHEFKLSSDTNS